MSRYTLEFDDKTEMEMHRIARYLKIPKWLPRKTKYLIIVEKAFELLMEVSVALGKEARADGWRLYVENEAKNFRREIVEL